MKLAIVLFVTLIFSNSLFSQTGTIKGTVTDSLTGDPLIGANILIEHTSFGAATDEKGNFKFKNIPVGTYDLIISYIGYSQKKIENVKVETKKEVNLIVQLSAVFIEGEEVVVTGKAEGQLQAITQQLSSNKISTVSPFSNDDYNTEEYNYISENDYKDVFLSPLSTFSVDVDAASYSNARRFLMQGSVPPKDAVRVEEFINYFDYDYPKPDSEHPIKIYTEYGECPWNKDNYLVHIGIQGEKILSDERMPNNLTFLIDVSGSMSDQNKLPLLQKAFKMFVEQLDERDRIAIVVYAGNAGLVLPATSGKEKERIINAIESLNAGGSTAGGEGIMLAYKTAKENFLEDGNNRVILATDGDFNVGISNTSDLVQFVEEKKKDGIFLSVLGFGEFNLKDYRLESLADKGDGHYAYIDNILEAKKVFVDELTSTLYTIAKDVKIQVEFNPAKVKSYRLVGYENRLLNDEDFEDDKKDAGEIGAGHTVTALYEIVPLKSIDELSEQNKLKYQEMNLKESAARTDEILTVSVRYKNPDEDESILISSVISGKPVQIEKSSDIFKFSSAVAQFGMLLRDSEHKGSATYESVKNLAMNSMGNDKYGYRAEFLRLVDLASKIR